MSTARRYRVFATVEAAGTSPRYELLARSIAADREICERLDALPGPKRQPNLLFGAVQYLGGPTIGWEEFRGFLTQEWSAVEAVVVERSTQTNEAARAGILLPLLAQLPRPLALLEVGPSAGLCLQPDRYQYSYDGVIVGDPSPVRIAVRTDGPVPVPTAVPEVVWRVGIDRNPLDVRHPDDLAWLRALVWPEHHERRARLDAAARIAAAEPPELVTGDLVENLETVARSAPPDATTVVFHSAVLSYLSPAQRARFAAIVEGLPQVVWISNEFPGVIEGLTTSLRPPAFASTPAYFELGVGGKSVPGIGDPHGAWLSWRRDPRG